MDENQTDEKLKMKSDSQIAFSLSGSLSVFLSLLNRRVPMGPVGGLWHGGLLGRYAML